MQIWALIVDSFRESRDKKMFWVMLLVSTLAALALACIGFDENGWSMFFGAYKVPSAEYARGTRAATGIMGTIVTEMLIGTYVGWLGTVACLVATTGIFPNLMERGAIDVVLSKPMSRVWLFLGKYVGSLSFVLVQSTYFVLLSFLVLRWQVGRWLWGYLWCIPLLVALFSFIYCVCVLLAMWTRSALAALVLTLLFWVSIPGVAAMDEMLSGRISLTGQFSPGRTWQELGASARAVRAMRWILPKTSDIPVIAGRQMGAGSLTEAMKLFESTVAGAEQKGSSSLQMHMQVDPGTRAELEREDQRRARLTVQEVVGSSLLFEGVVLAVAAWIFCRRDF